MLLLCPDSGGLFCATVEIIRRCDKSSIVFVVIRFFVVRFYGAIDVSNINAINNNKCKAILLL